MGMFIAVTKMATGTNVMAIIGGKMTGPIHSNWTGCNKTETGETQGRIIISNSGQTLAQVPDPLHQTGHPSVVPDLLHQAGHPLVVPDLLHQAGHQQVVPDPQLLPAVLVPLLPAGHQVVAVPVPHLLVVVPDQLLPADRPVVVHVRQRPAGHQAVVPAHLLEEEEVNQC
jgi:hypothetical protein